MRKIGIIFVLIFFSLPVRAQQIVLPSPEGPYVVGTRSFEIDDSNRPEKNAWWGVRKFMAQAYYPSSSTSLHFKTHPICLKRLKLGK